MATFSHGSESTLLTRPVHGLGQPLTLLFLSAGAVIHSLADQQDVRRYGGLQQVLTFSYACLLVGSLALVGTPYLAGFYSKDVILELAAANYGLSTGFGYGLTCFSVLTTSYYSFRLLYLTFHCGPGPSGSVTNLRRRDLPSHDAPNTMISVLGLLACCSLVVGYCAKPMTIGLGSDFWGACFVMGPGVTGLVEAEFLPQTLKLVPLAATFTGALMAYVVSLALMPQTYAQSLRVPGLIRTLNQRWYYDKLLNVGLAYPGMHLGYGLLANFDKGLLELLPGTSSALSRSLRSTSKNLGLSQSGLISHYALVMIFSSLLALVALTSAGPYAYGDGRGVVILIAALAVL